MNFGKCIIFYKSNEWFHVYVLVLSSGYLDKYLALGSSLLLKADEYEPDSLTDPQGHLGGL